MIIPHKYLHSAPDSWEALPVTAGLNVNVGTALTVTGGKLVKAGTTTKPTYISMQKATTKEGQSLHVQRVRPETIYETQLSEASASIAVGKKYTLDAAAEKITATEASGVATVVDFDGTEAGSRVRVRFE